MATARDAEAREISAFLARVKAGPAGLLFRGDPGIGKTTMWSDTVSLATNLGFRVLKARVSAAETRLTFAVLADLLSDVDVAVFDSLAPVQRVALNRVLLRGDEGPATDERVAAAAFLSVLGLLTRQSPVLVAVDDGQWLDFATRAVLGFAARRLRGPIGIVATARTGEPDHRDTSWLQLSDPDRLATIRLRPLSLGGLHAVLRIRLERNISRPLITRIHEVSGGNPFYALELARSVEDRPGGRLGMPESLNALVGHRLAGFSEQTSAALLAAACAANLTVDELAQATGLSSEHVVSALEEVEAQGVIALDGNRVRFTHPLLSHGVYTRATAAQRRAMHRNLAALTELPELRARHLALAAVNPEEATLQAIDAAADAAGVRGAPSAAAELIDLAISLGGDNPQRRLRAAEQHFRAGSLDEADVHLEAIITTLRPGTLRTLALMLRGAVDGYGNRLLRAVDALSEAITGAGENPALRMQALMLSALAVGLTGDMGASVEFARRAVADADRLGVAELRSQALALWVHVSFMYGLGTDEQALHTALELEDPNSFAPVTLRASAVAAVNSAWSGNLHDARTRLANVLQACLDRGNEVDVVWAAEFTTTVELWLGHYSEAARVAQDAMLRAEQIGGRLHLIDALSCQAAVAAHTGRQDETHRAARTAIAMARDGNMTFKTTAPLSSLAFLHASLGNHEAVLVTLERVLTAFDPSHGTEVMVGGFLPDAIEALVALGRLDEAEPLVAALETNGARFGRAWMQAVGARGRAMLLAARGDLEAATLAARQAMEHHDRLPMPLERARTQLLAGQLHRRGRRKQAARRAIAEALRIFEALGSPLWAARARSELDRLNLAPGDASGLTPSERRVAEQAAAGLSNRDIAAALFLSPKTVEMNLSRVYRKLGIRSRSQLHARLPPENSRENPGSVS